MFGPAWRELEAWRRELERMAEMMGSPLPFRVAFLPGRSARSYPLTNISEDRENVYVQALAPGLNPDSLEITVLGNTLTLSGEKTGPTDVPRDAFHRTERSAGRFVRTIDLPVQVDSSRVTARYANGLLTITLPRAEASKPRQISVTIG